MSTRVMRIVAAGLCAGALMAPVAWAQDGASTDPAIEDVAGIVGARQALKEQVATMRGLIEEAVAAGDEDAFFDSADDLATIAAILQAFPHLFPANSSPDAIAAAGLDVATDASPAIWDDFAAFAAMADSVSQSALAASQSADFATLAAATEQVWAGCTACHDTYLNYDPFAGMESMGEVEVDSPFF